MEPWYYICEETGLAYVAGEEAFLKWSPRWMDFEDYLGWEERWEKFPTKRRTDGYSARMVMLAHDAWDETLSEEHRAEALKRLKEEAERPYNQEAWYRLGLLYRDGKGVPQDLKLAEAWIRKAAEKDHAVAMMTLGQMWMARDPKVGEHWMRMASRWGYGPAMEWIEARYPEEIAQQKAADAAFDKEVKRRHIATYYVLPRFGNTTEPEEQLRRLYADGRPVDPEDPEALAILERIKLRNMSALVDVARGFANKMFDLPESYEMSQKIVQMIANGRDGFAMYELVQWEGENCGVALPEGMYRVLMRRAAKLGDGRAQMVMGEWCESGREKEIPQSDEEAVKWYQLAADQGVEEAMIELGRRYLKGQGVEKSEERAYLWMRRAKRWGR